jgi:hypothetical protein
MRIFKINYELANGNNLIVGVLADNKDRAVAHLKGKVNGVKRINSISAGESDLHTIDENIVKKICKGYTSNDESEKLKEKLISLENRTSVKIKELEENLAEEQKKVNELKIKLQETQKQLKESKETEPKETKYACEICGKSFKTAKGLKIHKKSAH